VSLRVITLILLAWATSSRPETQSTLNVSWTVDGSITGGALLTWGASELAKGSLSPITCRWCSADELDRSVRNAVVWSNKGRAAAASDALQFAVPVGIAVYDLFAARSSGAIDESPKDVLVIAEAVAVAGVLTQTARYSFARVRPYAYYGHSDAGRDDHLSFWSGHTVVVFSAAAAGGTVGRIRGYAGWQWVYAVGFTGGAMTGYFRMASDNHWLTDVLASAAVGTGAGILVPWLHRAGPFGTSYQVLPAPGGLAVAGEF